MRHPPATLVAVLALALGACAIAQDPPPSAPAVPAAWSEAPPPGAAAPAPDWWRAFGSEELAHLIAAALGASPDIAIAAERVRQAEAQARIAGASLFPSLGFSAGTSRRESRPDGADWTASDGSSATLSASYELDLWGRNAAGLRGAEFSLRASRFDLATVRLTLISGVADGYFQLLSLRGRLAIAVGNLAIAERVQGVVESRVRNGAASGLDAARQRAAVLSLRASVTTLQLQERQTLHALAILTGSPPGAVRVTGSGVTGLRIPAVSPGIPADLLLRRPDLAAAEAQMGVAHANVAAARAALLPAISLTGSAGLASSVLLNVLSAPTAAVSLGGSLLQTVFDGGRMRAQVDVARSRERELLESYRKAILAGLGDVESALAAASRTAEQQALQAQVVEQARIALRLAEVRYREGADDLLTVLDAQRTLYQAEDQLSQLRLARLQAALGLTRALGGGWN